MYSHDGDADEPEWVKTEREQFVEFRDKNRDGKMDKEETKDWILPSDYDHAEAEARHLVYESDQNKVRRAAIGVCCTRWIFPNVLRFFLVSMSESLSRCRALQQRDGSQSFWT